MSNYPTDIQALIKNLQPVLDEMESQRQQSLARISQGWKRIGIGIFVTLLTCVAVVTIGAGFQEDSIVLAAVPAVIGIVFCVIAYYSYITGHKENYEWAYKNRVTKNLTRMVQSGMVYTPDRGISESAFKETGLYSSDIDRYHCEDLFAGKIGKTEIMFSEIHAEEKRERRDSDGNRSTYWVDIFKGMMVIADFNKNFQGWLTIKPDFAEKSFGWFGRKIQSFNSHLVRLENTDFENAFVVHASDQVEARYILTPDFQERLLKLRHWFGVDIRLSFFRSRLHLTIPNDDNWFEPNFDLPAHDTAQMKSLLSQMSSVFHLIELLDLNTRIWTKQ